MEDRFWAKVDRNGECWLWTAAVDKNGYGCINLSGSPTKKTRAHRYSYELHYGEFDPSLMVLHRCDTPGCVRPDHLFLGTAADNTADMIAKGRMPERVVMDDVPCPVCGTLFHPRRNGRKGDKQTCSKRCGSTLRPQNQRKTHCKWGHPFDEANTYIRPGTGQQVCRACAREAQARHTAKTGCGYGT